jgi:hypothetical protein
MPTRLAGIADWNHILNDKIIVYGNFNSHCQRWDPSCSYERDAIICKDWSENFIMQLVNDRQYVQEGSTGSKSVINVTWSLPLEY